MTILLADGSVFKALEREFWCGCCADWRDVRENQSDIVCESCDSVVATFRDRNVVINFGGDTGLIEGDGVI